MSASFLDHNGAASPSESQPPLRARHALAYADAFAIATAVAHRANLLTGDPEILDDGDPTWSVVDLRS